MSVVGYAYRTEIWGPECILNPLRERGLTKVAPTSIGVEQELDAIARRMGIDRAGQSFDTNDFPHVILSGAAHDGCLADNGYVSGQCGERCAGCGEPINERCPNIPDE